MFLLTYLAYNPHVATQTHTGITVNSV